MISLKQNGREVWLLISCLGDGDTGGGLLSFDGKELDIVDTAATTGLCVYGNELCRVLWSPSQTHTASTIIRYNQHGVVSRFDVDGLVDPHDLLWTGSEYVVASSMRDSIFWIDAAGQITRVFQAATAGDCWHINSLVMHDGRLLASAFGRFDTSRGWKEFLQGGTGCVFDVDSNADVFTSLCCPHSPRFTGDAWLICNSARSEVVVIDPYSRRIVNAVPLHDWTRGIVVLDDHILVGESVNRLQSSEARGAALAVLDRHTMEVTGRIQLPYREVYDLVTATPAMALGIARHGKQEAVIRACRASEKLDHSCPPGTP